MPARAVLRISRDKFDRLVEDAIASLPEEFACWIDEVPVLVEDEPSASERDPEDEGNPPFGVYEGDSILCDPGEASAIPPRIILYRKNLMDACDSLEQLAEEIRKTLLHELGHHAGMDEDQLDRLGYGPMEEDNDDSIDWDVDEER